MNKLKETENELKQISAKLAEIEEARSTVAEDFENLQSKFIKGSAKIDAVQTAQGKINLLDGIIASLKETKTAMQQKLAGYLETDRRKVELARAVVSPIRRKPLSTTIIKSARTLTEPSANSRRQCSLRALHIAEHRRRFEVIEEGEKFSFEDLAAAGVDAKAYATATTKYFNSPAIEFGEAIQIAENTLNRSERANLPKPALTDGVGLHFQIKAAKEDVIQ